MTIPSESNALIGNNFPGVMITPDGRAILSGTPLELFRWLENCFRKMALESDAEERSYPSLIDNKTLRTAGYFESFPQGATAATAPGLAHDCSLSPAVCYHCYPLLAQVPLKKETILTCQGCCFRHEQGRYEGLARLWEFTMREIVFCGPGDWVKEQREAWMKRILTFCDQCGLSVTLKESTDPFYGAASRGQQLLQKMKKLKYELRAGLRDGSTTAIASFNLHESHFTNNFGIRSISGEPFQTGCVAFGLERWVLALLGQIGSSHFPQLMTDQD